MSIYSSDDDNFISNVGKKITVKAGIGDDTIFSTTENNVIVANDGENLISLSAGGNTVSAGTGNDTVYIVGGKNSLNLGGGNDFISGFSENDTLVVDLNEYTTLKSGEDMLVSVEGNGTVTIEGANNFSPIIQGTLAGSEPTVDSDGVIHNSKNFAVVNGTDNDDSIENSGENVVIVSGSGNNTIRNFGNDAMIWGGDGNDWLISEGASATFVGGKGNNILTGGENVGNLYIHCEGANDTITNYSQAFDTISLNKGRIAETIKSADNDDVILRIADGNTNLGTITVKNAKNTHLTIYNESQNTMFAEDLNTFIDEYVSAVAKAFEKDKDIQSILTDGEDSEVLKEIKEANPELAKQIVDSVKQTDKIIKDYLVNDVNSNSSSDISNEVLNISNDTIEKSADIMSAIDFSVNALNGMTEMKEFGSVSKVTGPVSTGLSISLFMLYKHRYNTNISDWVEHGRVGSNWWEKLSAIRHENKKVFDGYVKSTITVSYAVGGTIVALALGIAATPATLAVGCIVAPIVLNWGYDKFIAPKFDKTANALGLQDEISQNMENMAWLRAIQSMSGYYAENKKNNVFLNGTPGKDRLVNYGNGVAVLAGMGYDKIENYRGDDVHIYAGNGNNNIINDTASNQHVRVTALDGDNTIQSDRYRDYEGAFIEVNAGDGDNNIDVGHGKVVVGDGDNVIRANGDVTAGNGDNYIYTEFDGVAIQVGDGDNIISALSSAKKMDVKITAGHGNNIIGTSSRSFINGDVTAGNGDNTIRAMGNVSAGHGNNFIIAAKDISVGEGNNTLRSDGNGNITTGNGDNIVLATSNLSDVKIETGSGNDTIESGISNQNVNIDADEGNNYIRANKLDNGYLHSGSGDDTILVSGSTSVKVEVSNGDNYILINASSGELNTGSGNDTIQWSGGTDNTDVKIDSSSGDDYISVASASNVEIDSGNGNNTVLGSGTIHSGSGNDYLSGSLIYAGEGNNTVWGYTVHSGNGNDYIGSGKLIYSGDGNNTVHASYNGTVFSGAGNDYIYGETYQNNGYINAGEGNNTIVSGGTIYSGSGNDYISGGNYINAGEGNNTIRTSGATIIAGNGNNICELDDTNFYRQKGCLLNLGDGNNSIVSKNYDTINTGSGDDFISGGTFVNAGDGNNTISSAKGTVISGNGNDFISGGTFINVGDGNNTISSVNKGTVIGGNGDDYISGNGSINAGNGNNTIKLNNRSTVFAGDDNDIFNGNKISRSYVDLGEGSNFISLSGGEYNEILTNSGNDTVIVANSHSCNLKLGNGENYVDVNSNRCVIITGNNNDTIFANASSSNIDTADGDDLIDLKGEYTNLMAGNGNNTINAVGSRNNNIYCGEGADVINISSTLSSYRNRIDAGNGENIITVDQNYNTIVSGNDGDIIEVIGSHNFIDAGSGDNLLNFNGNDNNIKTGAGNDTIIIEGSNNTVSAGLGDDNVILNHNGLTYHYFNGDGDDTIIGISEQDVIIIEGHTYTTLTSGDDLIINVGYGSIFIPDALKLSTPLTIQGTIASTFVSTVILDELSSSFEFSETDTSQTAALLEGDINGSMELALSNSDTATAQTADFSNSTGKKKVTLVEGVQDLKFNDEGGNVAVIESNSAGEKNIVLGNGGDLVIVEDTTTPINITAGSGEDTIITAGNNVTVDMTGGNTKIIASAGNVELTNYDAATGAGIQIDEVDDISQEIQNGNISFGNGELSFGDAKIKVNNADAESTTVNLYNNQGVCQKVSYTHENGGEIGSSEERDNLLLVGNNDSSKNNGSSLNGGNGNDIAIGGAGDYFDLGGGQNHVYIDENRSDSNNIATVALTASSGKTEVDGFNAEFGDTGDKILIDTSTAQVSYKNGQLTFNNGNAELVLNLAGNSLSLAESADLMLDDNFMDCTTLDEISPVTYEQCDYQNYYEFGTSQNTISSNADITFNGA